MPLQIVRQHADELRVPEECNQRVLIRMPIFFTVATGIVLPLTLVTITSGGYRQIRSDIDKPSNLRHEDFRTFSHIVARHSDCVRQRDLAGANLRGTSRLHELGGSADSEMIEASAGQAVPEQIPIG